MRILFAGTPRFAQIALEKLLQTSHEILAVYTQPDRKAGRGQHLTASPVKELALKHNLVVKQPDSLKDSSLQEDIKNYQADAFVVAAYGLLLPSVILHAPKFGCINIHPSLLPRFRGAAPLPRTIQSGDSLTGVCIMQMDEGLDTGPILLRKEYKLKPDETTATLHDVLANLGAEALVETLTLLEKNKIIPEQQDNSQATYANKICKEEALLDWTQEAKSIDRTIRAFNPWPIAYTSWQDKNLRIWNAKLIADHTDAEPRTIVHASKDGIDIAASNGVIRLLQLQLPGGKVLSAADFFNAHRHQLIVGQHLI